LVAEAVLSGARRVAACRILGISLRTLQRWEGDKDRGDQRQGPRSGPQNALSEAERALVVAVANSPVFRDLPPSQIVPILADAGVYLASEATFYRVLRENRLLAARGRAAARSHGRPAEHVADGPNEVWSWDITYLNSPVRGRFYYLYLVVDIWSRKIVGWAVHDSESADLAAALIREAALTAGVDPQSLVLHSDNGGPMKGATMLATLQWLGVVASLSRPSVPDDNPYSEALFRTLKYRPQYPDGAFDSLQEARIWVEKFVGWYNYEHRHSAIQFVTPAQRHAGEHLAILRARNEVYEEAKRERSNRWSGRTRNWSPLAEVVLNPSSVRRQPDQQEVSA
jgi:putative transposase